MKNNYIILLFCVVFAAPFWLASCIKTTDAPLPQPVLQLPPYTTEGKNTIGCLIDGEVFAVTNNASGILCEYYFNSFEPQLYGTFGVYGKKISRPQRYVGINIDTAVFDTGVYNIATFTNALDERATVMLEKESFQRFYCHRGMYGWLHIKKLDTTTKIASGTFEFDAVNENDPSDTVKIRQGRFDAKFIY